jgi:hypothetical protein
MQGFIRNSDGLVTEEEYQEHLKRVQAITTTETFWFHAKNASNNPPPGKRNKKTMLRDGLNILKSDLSPTLKERYFKDDFLPDYTKSLIVDSVNGIIGNIYTSTAALNAMTQKKRGKYEFIKDENNPKFKLIHEHIVPKKLFYRSLLSFIKHPSFNELWFEYLMDFFLIGATITSDENDLLNKKYREDMPDEFYDPQHNYYLNPWARYMMLDGIDLPERIEMNLVLWDTDLKSYSKTLLDYDSFSWFNSICKITLETDNHHKVGERLIK